MREILFRGKDGHGRWRYGFYFEQKEWEGGITHCMSRSNIDGPLRAVCHVEVDPATVGQYTGLCNKNGVKIFEGDIVFAGYGEYYQGQHEHSATMIIDMADYEALNALCNANVVEVIGNIHDNPELLKEESE